VRRSYSAEPAAPVGIFMALLLPPSPPRSHRLGLWFLIGLCALISLAEVYPPVTAPLAAVLVVLIVFGAVSQHRQRPTLAPSRPVARQIAQAPTRGLLPDPLRPWRGATETRGRGLPVLRADPC
jgi:hypothetical protein